MDAMSLNHASKFYNPKAESPTDVTRMLICLFDALGLI